MKIRHYLVSALFSLSATLIPSVAHALNQQCLITDKSICVDSYYPYIDNDYSQQLLLAEIAVKYAELGDLAKSQTIISMLTLEEPKQAAISGVEYIKNIAEARQTIDSLINQSDTNITHPSSQDTTEKATTEEINQLLVSVQTVLNSNDQYGLVPIIVQMTDLGLESEAQKLFKVLNNSVDKALTLIYLANIDIEQGNKDDAIAKIDLAYNSAMSIECNSWACNTDPDQSRLLDNSPLLASSSSENKRCFVTNSSICIFQGMWGNFGLDLTSEYNESRLLAEIALQYALLGNLQQAKDIINKLASPDIQQKTLSLLNSLPSTTQSTLKIPKITTQDQQKLLDAAKEAIETNNEEKLVRIAVEMAEVGLFDQAETISQSLKNQSLQTLILIEISNIYREMGDTKKAQAKLSESLDLATSLSCQFPNCTVPSRPL